MVNKEKLSEIAKIVSEKGFETKTFSTNATNIYLLGGKNMLINDMCLFLWMCEVQRWVLDEIGVLISIDLWERKDTYYYTIPHSNHIISDDYNTFEEALQEGLFKVVNSEGLWKK